MNFLNALDLSSSGLTAQRTRMNVIAMNLANVNATRTPEGGPYRRKQPVFAAQPLFDRFRVRVSGLDRQLEDVNITRIVDDRSDFKMVFDPSHPDADQFGYVMMPNVDVAEEMVDMISAKRSYEANVTAASASKNMALKALSLLR
jgi:flagellar basal-body rod protein FlgC